MLAIVMVLVGIGLAATLLYGGVSVLQNNSIARTQGRENIAAAMHGLASAYQSYAAANGTGPSTGTCKATDLVPTYISEIKYPAAGMSCTLGNDATYGDYICYSGSIQQQTYNGFMDACGANGTTTCGTTASLFPSGAYNVGTSCGVRTNSAAPSSWPATIAVTYWLKGQ